MAATVAEQPFEALAQRSALRSHLALVVALVAGLDALGLGATVVLALQLKFGFSSWPPPQVDWLTGNAFIDFGWVVPVWLLALSISGEYSRRRFGRSLLHVGSILRGSLAAAGLVAMLAYLVNYDMSRGFFALAFGIGTAYLLAQRWVLGRMVSAFRRRQNLSHRVVAVGDRVALTELDKALRRHPGLGYELVGVCTDQQGWSGSEVPVLGPAASAVGACTTYGADTLLMTSGSHSSFDLRHLSWELQDRDVDLVVVPNLIDVAGPRLHMHPVAGLPFLHVEPPQVARAMRWSKAIFDRVGAFTLLVLLSPVMLAVAVAVRLDSPGPSLYRHRRIGLEGKQFGVWKFRSMVPGADKLHQELVDEQGGVTLLFKLKGDPRVTRVGAFIRRYSLDELPQLFNVLVGDMSLVGPRPQVDEEVAAYDDHTHRRLLVRPGITGLWQVSGRSDLSIEESQRLDLYYVENWSMLSDLAILAKTVRAVLRHDGAY